MPTKNNLRFALLLIGSVIWSQADRVRAEDWPHWRGNQRNDHSAHDSGWQAGKKWPAERTTWEKQVGEGGSSPIVAAGKVFTLGWIANKDLVTCLDAATGEKLWQQQYVAPRYGRKATGDEGLYSGPSGCPEFDAATGVLYTLNGDGELRAWNTREAGKLIWRKNLYDEYDMPQRPKVGRSSLRDYGYTSSPLVFNDWLLVETGSSRGNVIAFDKATGKEVWASENKDIAGHTGGPVVMQVAGEPCLVVQTVKNLLVLKLSQTPGKTVAEYPWLTEYANSVVSPCVHGDSVAITAGYNHEKLVRLRITANGAEKVWESPIFSCVCTPVVVGERLYVAYQQLKCIDWQTGKPLWTGGRFGEAGSCIATADDKLIIWGGNGILALTEIGPQPPTKYVELARTDPLADSDVWPHVVLAAERLYCRDRQGKLKCWQLSK